MIRGRRDLRDEVRQKAPVHRPELGSERLGPWPRPQHREICERVRSRAPEGCARGVRREGRAGRRRLPWPGSLRRVFSSKGSRARCAVRRSRDSSRLSTRSAPWPGRCSITTAVRSLSPPAVTALGRSTMRWRSRRIGGVRRFAWSAGVPRRSGSFALPQGTGPTGPFSVAVWRPRAQERQARALAAGLLPKPRPARLPTNPHSPRSSPRIGWSRGSRRLPGSAPSGSR